MQILLNDLAPQGLPLDFKQTFEQARPVHVDIGFGKGRVLVDQPLGNAFNYIGIEKRRKHIDFVAQRLQARKIVNVRLLEGFAEEELPKYFAKHSVQRFSILFPDPWPKRKHLRRRIFAPEFLQILSDTLVPNGILWVVTDYRDYFAKMMECMALSPLFRPQSHDLPPPGLTHFEIKYAAQQREIYRAAFESCAP